MREDDVREASSAEVPRKEEGEDETMGEDDGEEEGCKEDNEYVNDEDGGKDSESHSSSGSMQESPHSTCHYSDRCCHLHSWAERSESGNSEDGSFGELSISEDTGGKGEGEAEHPQALPSSPLCEQESSGESPEVIGQAVPGETTSTVGDLPLQAARMQLSSMPQRMS